MKKIIVMFAMILFLPQYFAFANFEINEIMYDLKTGSDTGREWIEIFNNSDSAADFSTYKFFEGDVNHKIVLTQGQAKIPARGYAIIIENTEKFKTDWPNNSFNIFDSTFSLNNTGEALAIKDGEVIVDQYVYQASLGGAGDGKTLQKINGSWAVAIPTPGVENKITYVPSPVPAPSPARKKTSGTVQKLVVEENSDSLELNGETRSDVSKPTETLEYKDQNENNHLYFFVTTWIGLIFGGAGAVYFIRRKKNVSEAGNDFEILEE